MSRAGRKRRQVIDPNAVPNMKTRGATKVPNVKLRPAPAPSSQPVKRQISPPRVVCDDARTNGEVNLDVGKNPFAGVVLCATGDLDKRTLFAHAQELGATRANDFTNLVTHLVADAPGSLKYKCALERHLPILKPSWVEEAYRMWLNGEVVDKKQTILDHRLPIFSGVRLCVTGMEDLELRNKVRDLLEKEGGVYLKSLDKTTTHLLSSSSAESPKLRWANSYNKTQVESHRICLVWEEWFWDSLEFGGRWDEDEYQTTRPRPSRKTIAQNSTMTKDETDKNGLPTATPSQRAPIPPSLPICALLGEDPPESGKMNKVPDARQVFYSSIFQGRDKTKGLRRTEHPESAEGSILARNHPESTNYHQETENRLTTKHNHTDSVLTCLSDRRITSFGSSHASQSRRPLRCIVSSTLNADTNMQHVPGSRPENQSGLFAGYAFRAFGEANRPNLRHALEERGGRWLDEEDEEADFLVVRLVNGDMYWRDEADEADRRKYRTECWVERCIFEERICAPDEHIVFTPLKIETPVLGFEKLYLSLSGLDTAEACWVKRLVRALGGNLAPTFSRHSTHLMCPSGHGAKFDKAKEWGIHVVGTDWLIEIATTGKIPSVKQSQVTLETKGESTPCASIREIAEGPSTSPKQEAKSNPPSPIKVQSRPSSAHSPPFREARGLRTAITALLGKRGADDGDEADSLAQKRQGRMNKRPRFPSKTKSELEPRRGPSPALSFFSNSPPLSHMLYFDDMDVIPEEQASLRVVYEDPGQRAEKNRLIALFDGERATSDLSKSGGKNNSDVADGNHDSSNCMEDTRMTTRRKSSRRSRTSGG